MIWHPGYEKLSTMKRMKENIQDHMGNTIGLQRELNQLQLGRGGKDLAFSTNVSGSNLTSHDMIPSGSSQQSLTYMQETKGGSIVKSSNFSSLKRRGS